MTKINHHEPSNATVGRAVSEYDPGPTRCTLIASLPFLVLLVLTPAHIYLGNQQYFDHRHIIVIHIWAAYLVIPLAVYLLFRWGPRLRKPLAYPLAVLGVFLCGVYLFTPTTVGEPPPQDGIRNILEPVAWSAVDIGIWILIWVAIRRLPERALVDIVAMFSVFLSIAAPALVIIESLRADPAVSRWADSTLPAPPLNQELPNIFHLVFDGFEGFLLPRIVSEPQFTSTFAGFTWYQNALSNYTVTSLSFPSFMIGREFDMFVTPKSAGRLGRSEGLIKTLSSNGFRVRQYNAYFINNHQSSHERFSTASIETELYGNLRHMVQLLDLSLLVAAPTALKTETVINKRGLFSHWFFRNKRAIADWTRNPPLLSLLMFSRLIDDLPQTTPHGLYLNAHFLLPHSPKTLTPSCNYEPSRDNTMMPHLEQTVCTTIKIGEFLDTLRNLDRFRDAMIVIHSDHGDILRRRPLLLVKYPGRSQEPLEVARYQVQLLDIAPTILKAVGLEDTGLSGMPLQVVNSETSRDIVVWDSDPKNR